MWITYNGKIIPFKSIYQYSRDYTVLLEVKHLRGLDRYEVVRLIYRELFFRFNSHFSPKFGFYKFKIISNSNRYQPLVVDLGTYAFFGLVVSEPVEIYYICG